MLRNIRILIIASLMLVGAASATYASLADTEKKNTEQAVSGPEITFPEKEFNFGFIPEDGGPVTHFFEFTNTGDAPLVIISATASCGCTRPSYPTEPIAPGKKGKIKVTFIPEGRPGEFEKVIKVRTNDKESKKISLKIVGTVTVK